MNEYEGGKEGAMGILKVPHWLMLSWSFLLSSWLLRKCCRVVLT